jgi:PAS domain-containing protein
VGRNNSVGLGAKDPCITSFNREAERITGVSRRVAIGKKCHEASAH